MNRYQLTSDDPKDPLHRLYVEEDPVSGLITIEEESITSTSAQAQATGTRGALDLTRDRARWLYFALGRVLMRIEMLDENARESYALPSDFCTRCGFPKPDDYPAVKRFCDDDRGPCEYASAPAPRKETP